MLQFQTVAEKTAKNFRGPLFSAAPCIGLRRARCRWLSALCLCNQSSR